MYEQNPERPKTGAGQSHTAWKWRKQEREETTWNKWELKNHRARQQLFAFAFPPASTAVQCVVRLPVPHFPPAPAQTPRKEPQTDEKSHKQGQDSSASLYTHTHTQAPTSCIPQNCYVSMKKRNLDI